VKKNLKKLLQQIKISSPKVSPKETVSVKIMETKTPLASIASNGSGEGLAEYTDFMEAEELEEVRKLGGLRQCDQIGRHFSI